MRGFPLLMLSPSSFQNTMSFRLLCISQYWISIIREPVPLCSDSFLLYHFFSDIWNWILQRYHFPITDKKCLFLARWIFCLAPLLFPFICLLLHCSCSSLSSFLTSFSHSLFLLLLFLYFLLRSSCVAPNSFCRHFWCPAPLLASLSLEMMQWL